MKVNRRQRPAIGQVQEVTVTLTGLEIIIVSSALSAAIGLLSVTSDDGHNALVIDRLNGIINGNKPIADEAFESFMEDADKLLADEEAEEERKVQQAENH